jgi:hypothetical protein
MRSRRAVVLASQLAGLTCMESFRLREMLKCCKAVVGIISIDSFIVYNHPILDQRVAIRLRTEAAAHVSVLCGAGLPHHLHVQTISPWQRPASSPAPSSQPQAINHD